MSHVLSAWSTEPPAPRRGPATYPFTKRRVTPTTIITDSEQRKKELTRKLLIITICSILMDLITTLLVFLPIIVLFENHETLAFSCLFFVRMFFLIERCIDEIALQNYFTFFAKIRAIWSILEVGMFIWSMWIERRVWWALGLAGCLVLANIGHFWALYHCHHQVILPLIPLLPLRTPLPPHFRKRDPIARIHYFYRPEGRLRLQNFHYE